MLFSTGEKELFWGLLSVRRQYCSRQKAFLEKTHKHISLSKAGWQKFREGTKGLRRKVKTQTKILSPNIRYFVAILRFVAIFAIFGRLLKQIIGLKTVFPGQEVHFYMVYIAYSIESKLQFCNYARKQ